MATRLPSVLCPIDFSVHSRSALSYAAAIAKHFGARLTIVTVDDPLLVQAAGASGLVPSYSDATARELRRFCGDVLANPGAMTVEFRIAVGKPATEILREARQTGSDLIVISSHGRSGVRKMFFGSTTERVLRETTVPVLVTSDDRHPTSLADIARTVDRVLAPVDLTNASLHQLTIAAGISQALSVPLLIAHVLEPIFIPYDVRRAIPGVDATRRADAEEQLSQLMDALHDGVRAESMTLTGDPSEEIVRLAQTRGANLIVIGLHSSGYLGPRMGSVTYRVLCSTGALVLAIPPAAAATTSNTVHPDATPAAV